MLGTTSDKENGKKSGDTKFNNPLQELLLYGT